MIEPRPLKLATVVGLSAVLLLSAGTLSGCGGGPRRQLQSITVSPQSAVAQNGQSPQFTATGQFNTAPTSVTPLAVSFVVRGPGFDLAGPGYSLSTQPASFPCIIPGTTVLVIAIAPVDPNAPPSGPMPSQIFQDLVVNHVTTSEGGFLAGIAQLTCP